jgi:L-threonylcarbamoyladenylate synthase
VTVLSGPDGVTEAIRLLGGGHVVALPTETVYGLGADASRPSAVRRIFELKGRPPTHPLIVHLGDAAALGDWGVVDDRGLALARHCWPGPLTIVVPRQARVPDVVTGGRDTVGLRVPAHELARTVCSAIGGIAAPSANRFGKVSPTTAGHVVHDLGPEVPVLDGGPCTIGIESTIVELVGSKAAVLRRGAMSAADIAAVIGEPVAEAIDGPSRAPGMLPSHYAPDCAVVLIADADEASALAAARGGRLLAPDVGDEVWARSLYDWLREADRDGVELLVVVPPHGSSLAEAICDRLTRAAHRSE